jgi:UPF0489 domain
VALFQLFNHKLVVSEMMKKIKIANKDIYIVDSHNQVLEAWESSPGLNIFSLDYHTDTKAAFHNYSYWRADSEMKSGRCSNHDERMRELSDQKITQYLENKITIKQINDNLKHDEHIDFAVQTDMVDMVFVLSTNRNTKSSNSNVYIADSPEKNEDQSIIEFSPLCIPVCNKEIHDNDCRNLRAESLIEDIFLKDAISQAESFKSSFFENYILDIDCDYFNTEKCLYPDNIEVFKKLIRNSRMVTIALEPECVKICRHKGCGLTSEIIMDRLLSIINEI